MSVRKSSHGTIFLIVSSGSPRALIASSLRSTSKKPFCPMTRSLHPPMTACGHRVRFVATWREEFFEVPEGLRQEHRNIESLLGVLEQELSVFDRGERPDYEVVLAVIDYFKDHPDSCHHPKEDMIVEKLKARDPGAAATVGDLEAQHQEGARRLRRVAQAVERVLSDQDLPDRGRHHCRLRLAGTAAHGH